MQKFLLFAGALICFLGVAFGAFGAHALSSILDGKTASWFDTAVQYQFIHGLGLLFCGLLCPLFGRASLLAGLFMLIGMMVFCGTLYAMALGAPRWLGMVTPIGGGCLMLAWLVLAWSAARRSNLSKQI